MYIWIYKYLWGDNFEIYSDYKFKINLNEEYLISDS